MSKLSVAVLGLGTMGHPFAKNLLKKGFNVWVWNRSPGKDLDLVSAGAKRASSPAEAVRDVNVAISMLSTAKVTENVLLGSGGALSAMRENSILAQMATIGIESTMTLAREISTKYPKVKFVDAPVSGSKVPAENASILILASGDKEQVKPIEPVFDAISKGTKWLGPVGAGSRMKLVVNAWLIIMMEGTIESALLAKKLGFSPSEFWSVLEGGPLAAPFMKPKLAKIEKEDFSTEMALEWGLKDALLALDSSDREKLPSLNRISEIWKEAVEAGLGYEDISAFAKYVESKK